MDARRKRKATAHRTVVRNTICILSLLTAMGLLVFLLDSKLDHSDATQRLRDKAVALETMLANTLLHAQSNQAMPDGEPSLFHISPAALTSTESTSSSSSGSIAVTSSVETAAEAAASKNDNAGVPNPPQKSKYAYVTLISGIDSRFRYRGFLYNTLIMQRALRQAGSSADFIAMIGYAAATTAAARAPFQSDMDLLKRHGVIIHTLPRLLSEEHPLNFAEMALLKITPFSFTQYEKLQYFDGDVMPTRNMDCFFQLQQNTFTIGNVSPLNSGWFLLLPEQRAFSQLRQLALWRLGRDWDELRGWGQQMPTGLSVAGGRPINKWLFNGADMDQGLFLHYFVLQRGNAMLVDTRLKLARSYEHGLPQLQQLQQQQQEQQQQQVALAAPVESRMDDALRCCDGRLPTDHFAHFTGRSKPWLQEGLGQQQQQQQSQQKQKRNWALQMWCDHLDALQLDVNSSNVQQLRVGPSLGFFNANFPKGGYKTKPKLLL